MAHTSAPSYLTNHVKHKRKKGREQSKKIKQNRKKTQKRKKKKENPPHRDQMINNRKVSLTFLCLL
jgi:hypothetical protein